MGMAKYQKGEFLRKNKEDEVKQAIDTVLKDLDDFHNAANCICVLTNLRGARIPMASAFLRFLDPVNHRYGVIDRNVGCFLNKKGIMHFELDKNGYIIKSFPNVLGYQEFHNWLQQKAKELELEGATYEDIDRKGQPFKPVDVEMAIFAYTRYKRLKRTKECSD